MSWYLTRTVTIIRRQVEVDSGGNPVRDELGNEQYEDVLIALGGCSWDERSSVGSENVEARQQVISGRSLYCADPAVDIRATDAVEFPDNGYRYEVDGEIGRYTGSRFSNDHAVVVLRRVAG